MRSCSACGGLLPLDSRRDRLYCSTKCRNISYGSCSESGCEKPRRAKGLCASHYMKQHGYVRKVFGKTCAWCGCEYKTTRPDGRYCSLPCRDAGRRATVKFEIGCLVPETHPSRSTPVPFEHPCRWPRLICSVFYHDCEWCGGVFVSSRPRGVYCSARCRNRATKSRRGSRFRISPVKRRQLYERDGWMCQLCMEPVDPLLPSHDTWAATLDHIEPQCFALFPDHSDANLRLAHRWCNSVRQDGSGPSLLPVAA